MATSPPDALCPFCAIVEREDRDVREACREQNVVVFFPDEPATLGHTLIAPRLYVSDIWALTPDLAAHLDRATLAVAQALRRSMQPDGINVIQSNGEAATQTVRHLHNHVIPRWSGDPIGRIWPPSMNYSEADKDAVWDAIGSECSLL